ncbi:membrane-associated protease RseP (regulator of RpoE activity) [Salana multivorans]|uniref:Membrane-associated protease RseP (Regulator of RpoE activity) n=1 Tax=Salana multivorans TaxID=120377 RepID=A0A3N2D2C2_9MICO|nr:site-2 protease family protein [Salana multivorans]ROR93919.1 membrane-associated protease RseP (regulator of RpoE activity) [Salana multivorans]
MFWVGVGVFLLGLLVSIAWHELGHLLPAKRFGVLVQQYMVGFGPTLWSRVRGGTEYGVKAIPLGGYIRMVGMYPTDAQLPAATASRRVVGDRRGLRRWSREIAAEAREFSASEIAAGQESRTFSALPVRRRIVVMLGGPFANLVLGFVLLAIAFCGIGLPSTTTTIAAVSPCVAAGGAACTDADDPSPAAAAGIEPGDVVVAWDGTPIADWPDLQERIVTGEAAPAVVTVERAGTRLDLPISPTLVPAAEGTDPVPVVGITPVRELAPVSPGEFLGIFGDTVAQTFGLIVTLPVQLFDLVVALVTGGERDAGVIGIVGVGRIAGEATGTDNVFGVTGSVLLLLQLLGSLNLALFAFNLIPLLPLDGGHVAGALWEAVRRRVARWRGRPDPGPVDTARALPLTYVVIGAFLVMFVVLTVADLVAPITLTGG